MKQVGRTILLCLLLAALPALSACGAPSRADLPALYEQLTALPDCAEMLPMREKTIQNLYGIDPEACPQLVMAICADSLRVDEIWLIEAADETAAEELASLAGSHVEQVLRETESYLPEQYAVAKEYELLRIGSSMALFISPRAEEMADLFREALGSRSLFGQSR